MTVYPPHRPRLSRHFYLAHGLGNDYLVMSEGGAWVAGPEAVRLLCDRWEGVGSDGLVVVLDSTPDVPIGLRMFNPDGSEFERSGNGLRIAASGLYREGRAGEGVFPVAVGGEVVEMEVHGPPREGRYDVSVTMGRAQTGADAVGLSPSSHESGDAGRAHDLLETPETGPLPVHLVSIGNPHCVVFLEALGGDIEAHGGLSSSALARFGHGLSTHARFKAGANVQLARVVDPSTLEIRIWERGVGPTQASGTSACAVAVAAVESARIRPGEITIRMKGGDLEVVVTEDLSVTLRGPVVEVCQGELTESFAGALDRVGSES